MYSSIDRCIDRSMDKCIDKNIDKSIDYNMIGFDSEFLLDIYDDEAGTRIDRLISERVTDLSRSYIQKLIKEGYIKVNRNSIKSNYKVSKSDSVSVVFPKPQPLDIQPENIMLDIVYEDDDIIIINKPKNMVVHPAPGHYSGTVVNALMYHCGDNLSGINGVLRPGIVHRIDKDTTGLLIICKNDRAHQKIAGQLSVHSVNRKYVALVHGIISDDEGVIDKPISRGNIDRKIMAVNPEGKRAVTHYKVLKRYQLNNNKYSLIECRLETGRTHQIRVHMSSMNHPLVGDTVYGYNEKRQPFKTDGQMLHAKTIGFIHPSTDMYVEFDSELPLYFTNILNKLLTIG